MSRFMEALESLARKAERGASAPVVLAAFTLLYLPAALLVASSKLLWDDELYTLFIAKTGSLQGILKALETGADQHPPGFYYLTNLILQIFPLTYITVRLPSIAGFWLFCVCVYFILRRVTSPLWAVVGMLLPLLTGGFYYATEARGYGLVLGFIALAFLCWTLAAGDVLRRVVVPALAFSLAAAVSSHYYAVLACAALGAGECVRTVARRRIDWPVWLAFTAAALPFAIFPKVWSAAGSYSANFWAAPIFFNFSGFHLDMLGWVQGIVVAVLALTLLVASLNRGYEEPPPRRQPTAWWLTSCGAFLLLPLMTMCLALLVTHGYTQRYAISALLGSLLLLVYFFDRITTRAVALAALAIVVGCIAVRVPYLVAQYRQSVMDLREEVSIFSKVGSLPVVMTEPTIFHRFSFYAPRDLASNVSYLASPKSAIKYSGFDTVDRGFLDLQPWFPINIVPPEAFLKSHSLFLAYGSLNPWSWLQYEFNIDDLVALLSARRKEYLLFSVKNSRRIKGDPQLAADRMFLKVPATGRSLCQIYMPAGNCPVFSTNKN